MVFNKRCVKYNIPIHIRLGPLLLHKIDLDTTEYFFFIYILQIFLKTFFFFIFTYYRHFDKRFFA